MEKKKNFKKKKKKKKKGDLSIRSHDGDDSKRPRETSLDDSTKNTTNTDVLT